MKNYIKPTFVLAGITPLGLTTSGCAITEDEAAFMETYFGVKDWSKAFFDSGDGCKEEPTGIEGYCKFSYAEDTNYGYEKIFGSL